MLLAEWVAATVRGTVDAMTADGDRGSLLPVAMPRGHHDQCGKRRVAAAVAGCVMSLCSRRMAGEVCAAMVPIPAVQTALRTTAAQRSNGGGGGGGGGGAVLLRGPVVCWLLLALLLAVQFASSAHAHDDDNLATTTAAEGHRWGYADDVITATPTTGTGPTEAPAMPPTPPAAAASSSSMAFGGLFLLLLLSLGGYWLLTTGVIYGVAQLSGASIGYRSAVHAVGWSFSPTVCGILLYTLLAQSASVASRSDDASTPEGVSLSVHAAGEAAQLWLWYVGVPGLLGAVSLGVTLHSRVHQELRSSGRWYQTGNPARDQYRSAVGRGRAQAEAGAGRGAAAAAIAGVSCALCLWNEVTFT